MHNYHSYRSVQRGNPKDKNGYPDLTKARLAINGKPNGDLWLLLDQDPDALCEHYLPEGTL